MKKIITNKIEIFYIENNRKDQDKEPSTKSGKNSLLRQLEINNPAIWRRIFVCLWSCCVGRIAGYVTETTRPKTDKKTSKVGGLFVSSCLSTQVKLF